MSSIRLSFFRILCEFILLSSIFIANLVDAQSDIVTIEQESTTSLSPVRIFGDSADTSLAPSPKALSKEKLESNQFSDVTRALKQTPGVYSREEDGQGLRPNIGLRGTNPDRSKKVVFLEDGILIGPAPYSAPAAYYNPDMNHVESLEIYKGFSATTIGPNSVGGAIGYISSAVPLVSEYKLQSSAGSYGTTNFRLSAGAPTIWGGYLLQASRLGSKGFKRMEFANTSGFERLGLLGKLRFQLPGHSLSREHSLDLHFGYGTENSDETYVGLTRADFDSNPYSRYTSSALDNMKWNHKKLQLHHRIQFTENALLETALYRHEFARVWYRVDGFRDGTSLRDILNDPGSYERQIGILRGELDTSSLGVGGRNLNIRIANNDRSYFSQGLQTKYSTNIHWNDQLELSPVFMARLHQDGIRRTHSSDHFGMEARTLVRDNSPRELTASNSEVALALTAATQLPLRWQDWILAPALRIEQVRFQSEDQLNQEYSKVRGDRSLVPGLSLQRNFDSDFSLRGSVNRAETIAGLSSSAGEVKEVATNYEVELKFADNENLLSTNVTAFINDYSNLTETCATSSGCAANDLDSSFSGGRARISGIESGISKGFEFGSVFIPIQMNFTILNAKFANRFTSDSPTWGKGFVDVGDPLPYVPENQLSLSIGTEWANFRQETILMHQGRTFDQSAELGRKQIDAYSSLDWTGCYKWSKKTELSAKVENALNSRYIVAARPFGLRPGKPISASLGIKYIF